ncbi:hypothetical protein ACJX0J_012319, partial [Zea mays]
RAAALPAVEGSKMEAVATPTGVSEDEVEELGEGQHYAKELKNLCSEIITLRNEALEKYKILLSLRKKQISEVAGLKKKLDEILYISHASQSPRQEMTQLFAGNHERHFFSFI